MTKAELRVVHKVTTEEDRRGSILNGRQIKTHLRCPRVHRNTHILFFLELSISWCFGSSDQFPLALQSGFSSVNHQSTFLPWDLCICLFYSSATYGWCVCKYGAWFPQFKGVTDLHPQRESVTICGAWMYVWYISGRTLMSAEDTQDGMCSALKSKRIYLFIRVKSSCYLRGHGLRPLTNQRLHFGCIAIPAMQSWLTVVLK